MRKFIIVVFFIFFIFLVAESQTIKLITYNIRYDNKADGENSWEFRKEKLIDLLDFYDADIFGIQEGLINQVRYIDSCLIQYGYVAVGRDDGKTQGEHCAVFFNKAKFEVINSISFWLSDTPDKVSKGWDAVCNRICTSVMFKERTTGWKFWVFNTHLDHIGKIAQQNSIRLIVNKIKLYNPDNLPLVLIGDFNMTPDNEVVKDLSRYLTDAETAVYKQDIYQNGTFNGFNFCKSVTERIDYIFTKGFKVNKYRVLTDSYNGRYLSDHFPVYAELHTIE